jgi:hypothetical protein
LIEKLNIRPHRGQLVRRDIHAIHCKVGSKDRYQFGGSASETSCASLASA